MVLGCAATNNFQVSRFHGAEHCVAVGRRIVRVLRVCITQPDNTTTKTTSTTAAQSTAATTSTGGRRTAELACIIPVGRMVVVLEVRPKGLAPLRNATHWNFVAIKSNFQLGIVRRERAYYSLGFQVVLWNFCTEVDFRRRMTNGW